ncbi:ion channel [Novosphingobium aquimarinum]|uniref:ion channel n=1 Tax=Novosphingobium aquimarinum TaxID=2682494 RepID=UPI0012EC1055|nr:ion channel [Novosphingobium aquimarinum]
MTITTQLLVGALMVGLTMIVQAGFVATAFAIDDRMIPSWFRKSRVGTTLLLASATIWMLLALTAAAWLWAGLFMALGAFQELEPALYFATVSLTTLGFGDVILSPEVRLLSAIVAANGLIMFGLSTAFLLEFVGDVRDEERASAARDR